MVGKRLQLRLLSDALTGERREGESGEEQSSEPREPGDSATRQEVCHEGPPTRPRGEDITWPDQVAPGAKRHLVPET